VPAFLCIAQISIYLRCHCFSRRKLYAPLPFLGRMAADRGSIGFAICGSNSTPSDDSAAYAKATNKAGEEFDDRASRAQTGLQDV